MLDNNKQTHISFAKYFFEELAKGNGSVIVTDNIIMLNDLAMMIFSSPELLKQDNDYVEVLGNIIKSCNILYNRTDMEILPIEDGMYDRLLELYREFNPNFQVGSAVVEFQSMYENTEEGNSIAERPIEFLETPSDELHKEIFHDLMKPYPIDKRDWHECPIIFNQEKITKRTHNTQHNHPDLVGTLDKCKFVSISKNDEVLGDLLNDPTIKILERDFFGKHIKDGLYDYHDKIEVICELKYDGISVEADCGFEVESARTRGDTGIGQASDITPILQGYTFKRADCMIGEKPIGIKFEAIMTKTNLQKFNELRGKNYKNCRTAIVGLFGASDGYKFRDLITLVPLALDRNDVPLINNRLEEIIFLNNVFVSHGEPLRYCYFKGTFIEVMLYIKAFYDEAMLARDYLNFMYDGIVVSYLDENLRKKLGRQNFINKYSMAVKFDPYKKQTMFTGYSWTIGQHGQITPMIHYNPVEFIGTIHTKSTGSSLERFNELGLKIGDFINVTYVNDVMPYVSRLECDHNRKNPNPVIPFPTECPVCGTKLIVSTSGKTASCPNEDCPGRSVKRMVNTLDKLNLKGFAEASVEALQVGHLYELYMLPNDEIINRLGNADGANLIKMLGQLIGGYKPDYFLMGALGFTGIARRKWQDILSKVTIKEMLEEYEVRGKDGLGMLLIKNLPNLMGSITYQTIVSEFGFFKDDIKCIIDNFLYTDSKSSRNEVKCQIRFSGCRNKQLAERLINEGYDADDSASVTKNTNILLIPHEGFESTKTRKASENCLIIPIDQFIENIENYIN